MIQNPNSVQNGAEVEFQPNQTTMAIGIGSIPGSSSSFQNPFSSSSSRPNIQPDSRSPSSNSINSSSSHSAAISTSVGAQAQNSITSPTNNKKVTRVRTGCLTCRRRKKKCDEQRCPETGGCIRCKQAGYECEGFPPLRQVKQGSTMHQKKNGNKRRNSSTIRSISSSNRRMSNAITSEESISPITSISPPHEEQEQSIGGMIEDGNAQGLFALQAAANSLISASSISSSQQQHNHFSSDRVSIQDLVNQSNITHQSPSFTSSSSPNTFSNVDQQPMQIDADHSPIQRRQIPITNNDTSSILPNNRQSQNSFISAPPPPQHHGSTHFQQSSPVASMHHGQSAGGGGGGNASGSTICSFIGECILVGRAICTACLSTIEPLFSPSDPIPNFHLPTPASSTGGASGTAFSPHNQHQQHEARHQPVMQSLIGYYSAVVTCWIEGCYPQEIANSSFFRDLVQYLITNIDENESLRLSVAAVASGYIGGGQLQWPEDLVAIQRWTNTLRQDATELVDVTVNVTRNSTSSSTTTTNIRRNELESGMNFPDRLARHTYIDRHLSKHAMLFYRMAKKSVEEAIQRASRKPSAQHSSTSAGQRRKKRTDGSSGGEEGEESEYIDYSLAKKYNSILVATANLCIFSWAEKSIETYYEDFDTVIQAVHTLFGGIRRVKLAYLNSLDTIGLAIVCWADTCAAIARGTRPYFELDEMELTEEEKEIIFDQTKSSTQFAFHSFNCPKSLFCCLNDLARLRFDCKAAPQRAWNGGNTEGGRQSSPLPAFLAQRAAQLDVRLKALTIETQHTTDVNGKSTTIITNPEGTTGITNRLQKTLIHSGSPNCSEMTRLAAILILYSAIYGKGPLHPTCKFALQSIIHLWTYGAIGFCRDVGCSNYLLPVFMASVIACDTRDRLLCEEAMNIVGHNEAVADASRQAVREVWKRTDEAGFPALWTDVVKPGSMEVAFL